MHLHCVFVSNLPRKGVLSPLVQEDRVDSSLSSASSSSTTFSFMSAEEQFDSDDDPEDEETKKTGPGVLSRILYSMGIRYSPTFPAFKVPESILEDEADGTSTPTPTSLIPLRKKDNPTTDTSGNDKRLRHVKSGLKALRSSVSTPLLRRPASLFFHDLKNTLPPMPTTKVNDKNNQSNVKSNSDKSSQRQASKSAMPNTTPPTVESPAKSTTKPVKEKKIRRLSVDPKKPRERFRRARSFLNGSNDSRISGRFSLADIMRPSTIFSTTTTRPSNDNVNTNTPSNSRKSIISTPANTSSNQSVNSARKSSVKGPRKLLQQNRRYTNTNTKTNDEDSSNGGDKPYEYQLKRQKTMDMMRTIGDYVYIRPSVQAKNFTASDTSQQQQPPPIPPVSLPSAPIGRERARNRSNTLVSEASCYSYHSARSSLYVDGSQPSDSMASISTTTIATSTNNSSRSEMTDSSANASRIHMLINIADEHANTMQQTKSRPSLSSDSRVDSECTLSEAGSSGRPSLMEEILTNPWVEVPSSSNSSIRSSLSIRDQKLPQQKSSEPVANESFSTIGRSRCRESIYKQFELQRSNSNAGCLNENRQSLLHEHQRTNRGGHDDDDDHEGGANAAAATNSMPCLAEDLTLSTNASSTYRSVYDVLYNRSQESGSVSSVFLSLARTASGKVTSIIPSLSDRSPESTITTTPLVAVSVLMGLHLIVCIIVLMDLLVTLLNLCISVSRHPTDQQPL